MNAFMMGGAEIVVILVLIVIVAAVVAIGVACVLAVGRKSGKMPGTGAKTAESRLRELGGLRENGLITEEEYQPRRVLISVLFTPAARTCIRTSFKAGFGTGTSRYSSFS